MNCDQFRRQFTYPVELRPDDNDTLLVTFPDIPEAVTIGDDEADALAHAVDALETMIIAKMDDREDIPLPSPLNGRPGVTLPPLTAMKVALYREMRQAHLRKADLARRLNWRPSQVDRLFDIRHASRVDQIETALRALGKTMMVEIRDL